MKVIRFCLVEIISLTPRFNAVEAGSEKEKPFKRFFSASAFNTRLKQGVNEKFSTRQSGFFTLPGVRLAAGGLISIIQPCSTSN
ncbi:MAG TPA: hypothetical protein VIK53_19495 [Verrucomicrobiae bacterium]